MDEAGKDNPGSQKEVKERKVTDVLAQLREVFGEDNVEIKDKEKEVVCKSNLEHDQQCSLIINFDDLEGATEVDELFSIRNIYGLSESEMEELRKDYRSSWLLRLPIYRITISSLSIDGIDLLDRMGNKDNVKRFRLLVPRLKGLEDYQQIPRYPINRSVILNWLPNMYWDYNFEYDGVLKNKKGDLEFRPIFKEENLFGFLHEYCHSVLPDAQDNYPLLKGLSKRELAEIRNSTEEVTPEEFGDQQKEYATFTLKKEKEANREVRTFLEDEEVRDVLFPGSNGAQRIDLLIENQMGPYLKRYSQQ